MRRGYSTAISQLLGIQTTAMVMLTTESLLPTLHQLTTPPTNSNFESYSFIFFSNMFLVVLSSKIFHFRILYTGKYFLIFKKGSLMWSTFKITQKLASMPRTGLYSPVAPLSRKLYLHCSVSVDSSYRFGIISSPLTLYHNPANFNIN